MLMALDIDRVARDARGAAKFLVDQAAVSGKRVGVIGYCMGGSSRCSRVPSRPS